MVRRMYCSPVRAMVAMPWHIEGLDCELGWCADRLAASMNASACVSRFKSTPADNPWTGRKRKMWGHGYKCDYSNSMLPDIG